MSKSRFTVVAGQVNCAVQYLFINVSVVVIDFCCRLHSIIL